MPLVNKLKNIKCKTPTFLYVSVCFAVLFFLSFVATLIAYCLILKNSEKVNSEEDLTCTTAECIFTAADMLKYVDFKNDPCQDFYEYACGNYDKHVIISDDQSEVSVFGRMHGKRDMQLKSIMEDQTPSVQYPIVSKLVRTNYESCMNVNVIEERGLTPLRRLIDQYGKWPIFDKNWLPANYQWEIVEAQLSRFLGVEAFVGAALKEDSINSSNLIITLDQPRFTLDNKIYYSNGTDTPILHALLVYMVETMKILGADESDALIQMKEVIRLEIQLAQIVFQDTSGKSEIELYNPMTFNDLIADIPTIKWSEWRKNVFPSELNVTNWEKISVPGLTYFRQLSDVLETAPKRALSNYHLWKLIDSTVDSWPAKYRENYLAFRQTFTGISAEEPRWVQCVRSTSSLLTWPVGALYVKKYFMEKAKLEMENLVTNLKTAMRNQLQNNEWMNTGAKRSALLKLELMVQRIGYPDYIENETKIMEGLEEIGELNKNEFFENNLKISSRLIDFTMKQLRKSVDKNDWQISPSVVNAFYAPSANEISFPAGFLQYPTFVMGAPRYVYYSRIGAVIGHEITHGYDDQGSQYDAIGNVRKWWDERTMENFLDKSSCFLDQYNNVIEPITGISLNGQLTLGENIADNGGIKLAHKAYRLWLKNAKLYKEASLPGFRNYSNEQMFFLSYAHLLCEKVRPESIEFDINTEEHSQGKFRVNIPLQNFDEFSSAFNCKPNSPMNPVKKCSIW